MRTLVLTLTLTLLIPAWSRPLNVAQRAWVGAAELAHERCGEVDEAAALKALEAACAPQHGGLHQVAILAKRLNATAEDAFFAALGRRHADELTCGADFAAKVAADEAGALGDVADKLRAAREARRAWINAVKDLHASGAAAGQMCPTRVDELDRSSYANPKRNAICERMIKARAAFAMVQGAVPLVQTPKIAEFVKAYAERDDDLPPEELNASLARAFTGAASELRAQSGTLAARVRERGGGDFGIEERRSLLGDPLVTAAVVANNPAALTDVKCRADARVGLGADARDTALALATLGLGGAGLAFRGVSLAAGALRGVQAARAVGHLSLGAARVLGAGAAFAAVGAGTAGAAQACFKVPVRASQACAAAPKIEHLKSETCALAASLAGLDASGVVPGVTLAKFFSLGFGAKKAAQGTEALRVTERVGLRTSSGKARVGEVVKLNHGADGQVESALVRWRDPETGDFKQKNVALAELARNLGATTTLPLRGDRATDAFRTAFNDDAFTMENRFVSYVDVGGQRRAAHVIERRGDGVEVEVLAGKTVERKLLSAAEVESARVSATAAGPEFFSAYTQGLFAGRPSHGINATRSINQRTYYDGAGPRQVQVVNDHTYRRATVARGDIVEHHQPGLLAPGEYTYAVLEDGTVVTGRVHDNFEYGVKHSHLADGRRVLVAGEVKVPEGARGFDYNTESGTYTRELITTYGANPAELSERAGRALSLMMGRPGAPTTRLFWADRAPDARAVRGYCADRNFLAFNAELCRGAGALAH